MGRTRATAGDPRRKAVHNSLHLQAEDCEGLLAIGQGHKVPAGHGAIMRAPVASGVHTIVDEVVDLGVAEGKA